MSPTAPEIVELRVDGMDCNNCAMSIQRYLERKGLEDVLVNFQTHEVRYRRDDRRLDNEAVKAGINKLGFTVVEDPPEQPRRARARPSPPRHQTIARRRLLFCAGLTAPLLIAHLLMSVGVEVGPDA